MEGMSLDGSAPLLRREFPAERREKLEADLAAAEDVHAADPDGVDAIVWHARRLGYLDRYTEAIAVLTRGLALHPDEPQLYRHRGHRYITVRKYQAAVADFTAAAALCEGEGGVPDSVEPDGAPNAAGIPTSTLHTNIYYHLGLARFLLGQYQLAADAYRTGLDCELCTVDMRVAFSDWLYMSLRRLGNLTEAAEALAAAGDEKDLIEDFAYQKRLQLYKGLIGPEEVLSPVSTYDRLRQRKIAISFLHLCFCSSIVETQFLVALISHDKRSFTETGSEQAQGTVGQKEGLFSSQDAAPLDVATQGFGVADWYLGQGGAANEKEAIALLTQVAASDYWPSFAACAAEADLLRLSTAPKSTVIFWIRHGARGLFRFLIFLNRAFAKTRSGRMHGSVRTNHPFAQRTARTTPRRRTRRQRSISSTLTRPPPATPSSGAPPSGMPSTTGTTTLT